MVNYFTLSCLQICTDLCLTALVAAQQERPRWKGLVWFDGRLLATSSSESNIPAASRTIWREGTSSSSLVLDCPKCLVSFDPYAYHQCILFTLGEAPSTSRAASGLVSLQDPFDTFEEVGFQKSLPMFRF